MSALRPERALFPNSGPGKPLSDKGPLLSESGQLMVTIDGHFMVSLPKSSDSDLNVRFATFPTGSSLVPLPGQVMFLIRLTQSGFDGGESFNELAIMI
jgi:hypothetical protein